MEVNIWNRPTALFEMLSSHLASLRFRIRLAMIQQIPLLANQLGKDFFTEKLTALCVGWLGDDIASIRLAAATNLKVRDQSRYSSLQCFASSGSRKSNAGARRLVRHRLGGRLFDSFNY